MVKVARLVLAAALLLLPFLKTDAARGQTANEVLAAAAQASAANVISFANIEFEAEITDPLTPELVNQLVDRQEQGLRIAIETYKDQPAVRQQYELLLSRNATAVKEQAKDYVRRKIIGVYRMAGPQLGGDRLFEAKVIRSNAEPYQVSILQRHLYASSLRSVQYDRSLQHAVVSGTGATLGMLEPIQVGRLFGPIATLAAGTAEVDCSFDESYPPQRPTEVCIQFQSQKPLLSGKVVVDPERGHVCPLFELDDALGPVLRVQCCDYFESASGIWFPRQCSAKHFLPEGKRDVEMQFRPGGVRLNLPLSPDLFAIDIPRGTMIHYQLGNTQQVRTNCSINVDIDGVEQLLSHRCLQPAVSSSSAFGLVLPIGLTVLAGMAVFWIRGRVRCGV